MIRTRLSALLKERSWTQAELARRAGLRPATVNALLHGQAKGIDFSTLDALCSAMKVGPGEILERTSRKA